MERDFTTKDRPPARQLSWWQDVLSEVYYNLEVASAHRESFFGRVTERRVGCASITAFYGDQQRVLRSQARIARDDEDAVALVMPQNAPLYYSQAGRSGYRSPGSYVLVHTRDFYELSCPDGFSNLTVKLPAQPLRERLPFFEDHCASGFQPDQRLAGVLQDYALWLVRQRDSLSPGMADSLSEQLLELLVALLESEKAGQDRPAPGSPSSRQAEALRQRAVAQIEAQLCDPELTPARLAGHLGISPSYLHRLFRDQGLSIGRWITVKRLQRGYELLTLPGSACGTVAEVAYAVGFTSQAHFSACFKQQFGVTPTLARARGRLGLPPLGFPGSRENAAELQKNRKQDAAGSL
ncbi:MAG: AraC family transcriptional regulator [Pseudomonadota bacterium]